MTATLLDDATQARVVAAYLERRLAELVEIAAENEKLMERVHGLTVALLRASTMEVTARTVIARLSADFHTERVSLLLFGAEPRLPRADWLQQIAGGAAALPEFADFLHKGEPSSGRLSTDKLTRLFGEHATGLQSVALMPLGDAGILAIGSADEPLPARHGHAVPEDDLGHHHRRAGALAGCLLSRR